MPATQPLSTAQLLKIFEAGLANWAAMNSGRVAIAGDLWSGINMLQMQPGSFQAIIVWAGNKKRGDYEETGAVDHTFQVILSCGNAFREEPADNLVDSFAGGKPLYTLCDECTAAARGIEFPDRVTESTLNFTGSDPVVIQGNYPIDAYQLTFTLGAQLQTAITLN